MLGINADRAVFFHAVKQASESMMSRLIFRAICCIVERAYWISRDPLQVAGSVVVRVLILPAYRSCARPDRNVTIGLDNCEVNRTCGETPLGQAHCAGGWAWQPAPSSTWAWDNETFGLQPRRSAAAVSGFLDAVNASVEAVKAAQVEWDANVNATDEVRGNLNESSVILLTLSLHHY